MQKMELSVILPVRNIGQEIAGILRSVAGQASGLEAEFIIVDMGSRDQTVLEAVQFIKESKLKGFVIQNGETTVSSALNTGIQKAGGDYISFIFARRLYRDFLKGYWKTAQRTEADFIYGCVSEEQSMVAERRLMGTARGMESGTECMKNYLRGNLKIDISAVFVRRDFLRRQGIGFYDDCSHGYVEEFVFRCLLLADSVVQAPVVIKRDNVYELKRGKNAPFGKEILQRTEAALRVLDLMRTNGKKDAELLRLYSGERIPAVLMESIDIMLREGIPYRQVKQLLKNRGYAKLLKTDKKAPSALQRQVFLWNTLPGLYHPNPKE